MATSSIFANFNINDKKTANNFVKALDKSIKNNKNKSIKIEDNLLTDYNKIKILLAKGKYK